MYPSNGIQDTSLFLFSDNTYTNPSSTNEDFSSSSLLNVFPSSHFINFNDEAVFFQDFQDVLDHDQEMVTREGASNSNMSKIADDKKKKLSCGGSSKLQEQIRINRRCKKDRHSKITTPNGSSRGRRIRLSLDVAKEFFGLQDMLGFDKASKTVEWLLMESENAIKEVTTKCVFGMKHNPRPSTSLISATDELEPETMTKEKPKGGTQKVSYSRPVTRGLREKARARARERTQEKKRLQLVGGFTDYDHRSRLYRTCSQKINIGSDDPLLRCKKYAAAGNKFLNMNSSDPTPVLEVEDIFNYSKQQPHSFKGSTNTEELITDHSFFLSDYNWNPYTNIFNLDHNSGTTL